MSSVDRKGLSHYLATHPHFGGVVVSKERRFIYLKSCKTAGTSILHGYLEKEVPDLIYRRRDPRFQAWFDEITDSDLSNYYMFTVVRNPWDRVVSLAHYFKMSVDEFIGNIEKHRRNPEIHIHTLPCHSYSHMNGRQFVDRICRFESLQADINLVLDAIGVRRERLPHKNRTHHSHYSSYYVPTTRQHVADIFHDDVTLLGYMCEDEVSAQGQNRIRKFIGRLASRILRR